MCVFLKLAFRHEHAYDSYNVHKLIRCESSTAPVGFLLFVMST